jgi:Acetyltransferase (GNAT) domain
MHRFRAESAPSLPLTSRLAASDRTNPFCSAQYLAYRSADGSEPWVLYLEEQGEMIAACAAFMKTGKLGRLLEIPSLPGLPDNDAFWKGLLEFCAGAKVSDLLVNTFASRRSDIPSLSKENWRKRRCEYYLECQHPDLWKEIRKGHWYSVKKGRKAGLTLRHGTDAEACEEHAGLVHESMTRRLDRGEDVSSRKDIDQVLEITKNGAGVVFQALLDGEVKASNLILLAEKGAYNHSQGASREGFDCGAPHFLIYETVNYLRENSFEIFNLGGTDQLNSGLERFKSGFGATTSRVELEAAEFFLGSSLHGGVRSAVRLVQNAMSRWQAPSR